MSNHTTETNRGLTDAELDEASGGEGYQANGAIRAVTQWFQNNTFKSSGFSYELYQELHCAK
jgi:hypothetical protein